MDWEKAVIIVLALHTLLKAIRDAVDKTPHTDDNWFERLCSVISKIVGYLTVGQRPK